MGKEIMIKRLVRLVRRFQREHSGNVRSGYPPEVRGLARRLAASGLSIAEIAGMSGISAYSVRKWIDSNHVDKGGKGFARVRIQSAAEGSNYVVRGPGGFFVEMKGVEEVANLLKHLSVDKAA